MEEDLRFATCEGGRTADGGRVSGISTETLVDLTAATASILSLIHI